MPDHADFLKLARLAEEAARAKPEGFEREELLRRASALYEIARTLAEQAQRGEVAQGETTED